MFLTKLLEYFSRKFVLAVAGMGTGFYLVLAGHGSDLMSYTGLVIGVLGFYNGANVWQEYVTAKHGPSAKDSG